MHRKNKLRITQHQTKEGPDRGWGWVVAFSACFSTTIIVGIYRIYGLLLVTFVNEFNVPREKASWPIVVYLAVLKFESIVTCPLVHRFGIRPISMLSALIGAIGVACCSFVTSLETINLFFGVLFGLGSGPVYILIPILINQYFVKYRATAMGIALSGSGFGSFIFPPLHSFLLSYYGLSGYFLIISGIVLQTVVSSALLRPPSWTENKIKSKLNEKNFLDTKGNSKTSNKLSYTANKFDEEITTQNNSKGEKKDLHIGKSDTHLSADTDKISNTRLVNEHAIEKFNYFQASNSTTVNVLQHGSEIAEKACIFLEYTSETPHCTAFTIEEDNSSSCIQQNAANDPANASCSQSNLNSKLMTEISKQPTEVTQLEHIPDISLTEKMDSKCINTEDKVEHVSEELAYDKKIILSVRNIEPEVHRVCNQDLYDIANKSDPEEKPSLKEIEQLSFGKGNCRSDLPKNIKCEESRKPLSMLQIFKTVMMLPMFHITTIGNGCFQSLRLMYVVIIIDHLIDTGMPEADAKYVLYAYGITDFVGRLGFGWVTDRKFMKRRHFVMLCSTAVAVVFFSYPFLYGYAMHICFSGIFGLVQGCLVVMYPVLMMDYIESDMQNIAMGCMQFHNGFGMIIFPFIIGYFRDNLGSYMNMFYLFGAMSLGTTLLWSLESCFVKEKCTATVSKAGKNI